MLPRLTSEAVPEDKIRAALACVLDVRNHPMLIHCNKGKVRPIRPPHDAVFEGLMDGPAASDGLLGRMPPQDAALVVDGHL